MATEDDEATALQFFGILVGGAALTALLSWVMGTLEAEDIDPSSVADSAASTAAAWARTAIPYAVGIGVTLVALLVYRAWRRRRRRRRDDARQILAAALDHVMPRDWDPAMLTVTRWRGTDPKRGRLVLSPGCRDDDPEWRSSVADSVKVRLGAFAVDVTWPQRGSRFRRPSRIAEWAVTYEAPQSGRDDAETARAATGAPRSAQRHDPAEPIMDGVRLVPYGRDEDGHVVAWEIGARQPHSLVAGEVGSGRTQFMKSLAGGALKLGFAVVIGDPTAKDWSAFLGYPGVACVATSVEDRVALVAAMHAEMTRRMAVGELRAHEARHPSLATEKPARAALDDVSILFVLDEVKQNRDDLMSWWGRLSKPEKEAYGSTARIPPHLEMLTEMALHARFVGIHLLLGTRSPDAHGFADDDEHGGFRQTSVGRPGRITSSYLPDEQIFSDEFRATVAAVAPDVRLLELSGLSDTARDPESAVRVLRRRAGYDVDDHVE